MSVCCALEVYERGFFLAFLYEALDLFVLM